jgi:hypothetical protein
MVSLPSKALLVSKLTNKCIDLDYHSGHGNGTTIHQWDRHNGTNQQWVLRRIESDWYAIISEHTGKCLEVAGWSREPYGRIQQWDFHGGDNQLWWVEEVGDGTYALSSKHSGKYLDVLGNGLDNGTPLVQYDWHGGDNQRWWIREVGSMANIAYFLWENLLFFHDARSDQRYQQNLREITGEKQFAILGYNDESWTLFIVGKSVETTSSHQRMRAWLEMMKGGMCSACLSKLYGQTTGSCPQCGRDLTMYPY